MTARRARVEVRAALASTGQARVPATLDTQEAIVSRSALVGRAIPATDAVRALMSVGAPATRVTSARRANWFALVLPRVSVVAMGAARRMARAPAT